MWEKQEKEIATIKPRTVTIELSDADVDRLCEKAGKAGLTVPELLQSFIGDLVNGTYSNGSDERDYAEQWFDRCGYNYLAEPTFLRWLVENEDVYETILDWNELQEVKSDMEFEKKQEEPDAEAIKEYKDMIASLKEDLNDRFNEYKSSWGKSDDSTLGSAMEKVIHWNEQRDKLKCNESERIELENKQLRAVVTQSDPNFFKRKCRVCGCDWNHACKGGCSWVQDDLCSRCEEQL